MAIGRNMAYYDNEHFLSSITNPILIPSRTKYIGCIGVKISMRSLTHRTRSEVAKESINRLCVANNPKRKLDRDRPELSQIDQMLDDEPDLKYSGLDVQLCVTSTHLKVIWGKQTIIKHEMQNVSFASSGDEDTVDYVAYVAKDKEHGRKCFVLECEYNTAKQVLETIARGFQLRTKQMLSNNSTLPISPNASDHDRMLSLSNTACLTDSLDAEPDPNLSYHSNNENQQTEAVVALTRKALEKEPWFHGSYLSREESETRLKQDGDFLVRESMLDPGHFVLSVLHEGVKLHLLFDSMGQVRTKEKLFDNISHLVKHHHLGGSPIVAESRVVYLINGVRRGPRT